jgi:hypothetical protein
VWHAAHASGPANPGERVTACGAALPMSPPGAASTDRACVTWHVTQPTPTSSAHFEAVRSGMASGTWHLRQKRSGSRSYAFTYGSTLADTRCSDASHSRAIGS